MGNYEKLSAFVNKNRSSGSAGSKRWSGARDDGHGSFASMKSLTSVFTDKIRSFRRGEASTNEDGVLIGSVDEIESTDSTNGWFAQAGKDPCFPTLSKRQRVFGFVCFLIMGAFCFFMASLYLPMLVLKARKFACLFSLGSVFSIWSFSMLWGPWNHAKHLLSGNRLPFTAAYFGTLSATVYFSMWRKSTTLTVIFAVFQLLALVWYVISYIPGGQTGLKFFSKLFYMTASKTLQKTLPV